jgi:hypothetical protein
MSRAPDPPGHPVSATGAPGGTPYPDIADTSHATAAVAAFFRSFFTAETRKDIEATHTHFHPGKTVYVDATLGWALPDNASVRAMWEQYMPRWPAGAKSYPTRILGDMTSAVVFTTDTPELLGGEIRTISIADLQDGKIVRLVDYWDGRGFGAELAGSLRVPADSYPHDLAVSTVASRPGPIATAAAELTAAFAAGDAGREGELFSYDAVFADMALRAQLRGQAAIVRYLRRTLPALRPGIGPARSRRRPRRRIRMARRRPARCRRRGRARAQPGRHDHQVHRRLGRLPARRPGRHRARRRRGRPVTLRTQPDGATPENRSQVALAGDGAPLSPCVWQDTTGLPPGFPARSPLPGTPRTSGNYQNLPARTGNGLALADAPEAAGAAHRARPPMKKPTGRKQS